MYRSKDIKLVGFHVAADLDSPIQTLLENAVAQPVHLGEIVDEFPLVLRGGELHHLPPCLVSATEQRGLGKRILCSSTGVYGRPVYYFRDFDSVNSTTG